MKSDPRMPDAPADLERTDVTPATWLPGYELLGMVGAGGHGQVFKARQLALDRVVAVKLVELDESNRLDPAARFEREAVILGRLHHPNIVPVFDYGRHGDRLFMAMELLEGEDLGSRLERGGRLDAATAWSIIRQAAAGLAYASEHGVIHRDVKPNNLFLVPAPLGVELPAGVPMVKVTDFGLAQARWEAQTVDEAQTAPGLVLGTPAYMAPEQHRNGHVDRRADIYSLGATAYHALVGRPPFRGRTVWEIMASKLAPTRLSFAGMSPDSAALIQAMIATERGHRIQSYEDLITRIDRLPPEHGRPRHRAVRFVQTYCPPLILTAGVMLALAIGIRAGVRPAVVADDPPAAEFVSTGHIDSLFDGVSLDHWSTTGVWSVAKDEEGTIVLTGTGQLRRAFAAEENYQITIGLDVHEASTFEVQFAVPADGRSTRRHSLLISREVGATVGTRDGDRQPFIAVGEPILFPDAKWFKDRRPYLEVKIARMNEIWEARFRGELVGRVKDDGVPKSPEVRLIARDGQARIDSIVMERLVLRDQ
jgi:hypothetical protein